MFKSLFAAVTPYWAMIKVALVVAALVAVYMFGHHNASVADSLTAQKLATKQEKALNEQKDKVSSLEKDLANAQATYAAEYQARIDANNANAEATIAALKSGNLRLRKQLSCTIQFLGNVPDASSIRQFTGKDGQCGLSEADAEFLIRTAKRTNDLRDQVNQLIKVYNDAKAKIDNFNNGVTHGK